MKTRKNIISFTMILSLVFTSVGVQTVPAFAAQAGGTVTAADTAIRAAGKAVTDEVPPMLENAVVNGTILTLSFDEELNAESIPSSEDFNVKTTTNSGEAKMEGIGDIAAIDVYDNKAVITLADAVMPPDVVTIDYVPSKRPLCDISGNKAEGFADYGVTNVTGGRGLPDFVVEKIYDKLDTASFSKDLARQVYYAMRDYQGSKAELLASASDIAGILQSTSIYSGLSEEDKLKLCGFFNISDAFFAYSEKKKESIEQALLTYSRMTGYGMTAEEIDRAVETDRRDDIISEKEQEFLNQVNGTDRMRAALTGDDPFADVKYDKEKQLSAPFQHNSAANEQIDLASGTLEYNATDVVLPGAGGLDLVIERQYSTEQANYYDVLGRLRYRTSPSGSPQDSRMDVYERERRLEKNPDGTLGDRIEDTPYEVILNDLIESRALMGYYNMKQIEDRGSYYSAYLYKKTMTTAQTYMTDRQISEPITRNEELWQLGTGWSFNFSYIDIYTFYYDYMKLHLSDGREFGISSNWVNNLGHYTYKDIIFTIAATTVAGQTSSYNVTYADGKKEYFNSGGRLIAIVDRFGNTISFTYATVNNKIEIQITDSLDRIITLTNQTALNGYNKVLTLPDGKTVTYVITHNTARTIDAFDYLEDFAGQFNEYNLTKVINQEGEETSYTYTDTKCGSDFAARYDLDDDDWFMGVDPFDDGAFYYPNYYAGLTQITYPTDLTVKYEYYPRFNSWYDYGCRRDIAIKKRYEQQGAGIYNQKEYNYSYQYKKDGVIYDELYRADGYHNELPENRPFDEWMDWWVQEKDTGRNVTTRYTFDHKRGYCVQEKTYLDSDLIQDTSNAYCLFNQIVHPSKTTVTTIQYDTSDDQPWTTIECFDYDDRGNAVSYWPALSEGDTSDTEYKVSMTYHNTYNYLTGKAYKRDADTTISEQNVPTADGKAVEQALVYENDALKAKSEFVYDAYGNVTENKEYTDPIAGIYIETDSTYEDGAYLTGITVQDVLDADGTSIGSISRQATYDIYGRILTETDGNENVTAYGYDDIGRITAVTYPGIITKTYVYNTPSNQTMATDERGFVTRYQYDPAGNLTAVHSMDGGAAALLRSYEYDSSYRLIKEQNSLTAAGGGSTSYSYDHKDRVTQKSAKDAVDQTLSQEDCIYFDDKMTRTVAGDDSSEPVVTTEYTDKYGRVTKQGRFADETEIFNTFTYNYLGEVVKEKSARANAESFPEEYTAKYEYDFAGNVKKQYDVFDGYVTTVYDAAGRRFSVTDARSNESGGTYSTVYTYDALDRLVKEETPFTASSAAITKYYYDANGNLIRKQTANSLPGAAAAYTRTDYEYDDKDRLVHVKSYDGAAVAYQADYEYDDAGNMTAMETAGGTQRTEYGYDRYGNLTTLTDPLEQEETRVYNINGNMTSKTDKNGMTTSYTYDGLSRKLSQSAAIDGTAQTETFGYTATGALAYSQNSGIRTDYTYDELGRAVTELDTNGVEKTYTYDVHGNLKTSVAEVNGTPVKSMSFVYDKKDRLAGVYEEEDLVASYTYDANGNRNSLTYGNGTGADYAYNLANLVTSLENMEGSTTLSSYAYTYYLDGNQATKTDHTGRQTGYAYDGLGRLTQEAESGAADAITKAYTFDPAGNRATMSVTGAESYAADYDHDLNNRLTAETKVTGSVTEVIDYFYDDNGNTIAKRTGTLTASGGSETPVLSIDMTGAELYRYDGFDRMTGVENAGGTSIYTYRPDGLRLSKAVDGVTTTHMWEGNQITLELDEDDAVTNRYIRGIGLIMSDDNGWYLFNGHGDVVQLADGTGTVTKTYAYDAFGNERNLDPNDTNPFRYSGEYYDAETGTIYLRARYYEPETGRFLAEDSYAGNNNDPLSLNLYTYCYNNPVRYTDSSGHYVESVWDAFNIGLDVLDIGLDVYTGSYWSLLIDIPALIGDSAAISVPLIPGGIGTLKTPLRIEKTVKAYEKIQNLINTGTKLDPFAKAFLRQEARRFMLENSSNYAKAIAEGRQLNVHHVIPLEWAHVMGKGFDPNMLDNLAGVDPKIHKDVNRMWDRFRKDWKGKTPTANDVMEFVKKVNKEYGADFVR